MVLNNDECHCRRLTQNSSPTDKIRRRKTGRNRRKRRDSDCLSRWRTRESDDEEDLALYQWCKSRGLTSRTLSSNELSSTASTASHVSYPIRRGSYKTDVKSVMTLSRVKRSTSTVVISTMEETLFLTKLCPFITDKRVFVDLSKNCSYDVNEQITSENKSRSGKTTVQENINISTSSRKKVASIEGPKLSRSGRNASKLLNVETSTATSADETKAETSIKEITSQNHSEANAARKLDSTRTGVYSVTTPAVALAPQKGWTASVESDILRLYENTSAILDSSNLVFGWMDRTNITVDGSFATAVAYRQTDASKSIDQTIKRAEHTPSYVQMLAKMFKSRMQMRKNGEKQIEENVMTTGLDVGAFLTRNTSPKSDTAYINKTIASRQAKTGSEQTSKTRFRYRHLGMSSGKSKNTITENAEQSYSSTSRMIRIDPLDVGYTHGRYSKPLRCYLDGKSNDPFLQEEKTIDSFYRPTDCNQSGSRLVQRANSDHKSLDLPNNVFKAENVKGEVKLQQPSPHTSSIRANKHESKPTLVIARKARQSASSNVRMKPVEKISSSASSGQYSENSHSSSDRHIQRDSLVDWVTSVNSMPLRQSDRLMTKSQA